MVNHKKHEMHPVFPTVPTRDEAINGIRRLIETSERQRDAAALLAARHYYAQAAILALARLTEIGRAIDLIRTATVTEWDKPDYEHEEMWEDHWAKFHAWPYDWARVSAKLQHSKFHVQMAEEFDTKLELLLRTQRGAPKWTTPDDLGSLPHYEMILSVGDMLLAEFFNDVNYTVAHHEPDGQAYAIPIPPHLDLDAWNNIPD